MAHNKDSVGRTFAVIGGLCLVCSILVSGAAVGLRPLQEEAKARDRQTNILTVAGLPVEQVAKTYRQRIEARLVDLDSGMFVTAEGADSYDLRAAAKDPKKSIALLPQEDPAGIRRRAKLAPVYLARNAQGEVDSVILPVYGQGLWSTMYAFIAVATDGNTVKGITYYDHGETPGLGGEVENPRWQHLWVGKQLFGHYALTVIKGHADESERFKVDGLSGATLTSNGVQRTFEFWMGPKGYGPFLSRLSKGVLNHG